MDDLPTIEECRAFLDKINEGRRGISVALDLSPGETSVSLGDGPFTAEKTRLLLRGR